MSVRRVVLLLGLSGSLVVLLAGAAPAAMAQEGGEGELTSGPTASLTITKAAVALAADDDTAFTFDGTLGGFALADGESVTFAELAPGDYTVSETLPAGWVLDGITCLGVEPVVSVADASVTVTLQIGQPAACTFANHQEQVAAPGASLTIVEQTTPAGGTGFSFDGGTLGAFTLDDGGSAVLTDLAAGTYVVAQADPGADWPLREVECTAADYHVDGSAVALTLAEGEAAVCTFVNGTGALPHTGMGEFLVPLLVAGVWVLLLGLGAVVWPWMAKADHAHVVLPRSAR